MEGEDYIDHPFKKLQNWADLIAENLLIWFFMMAVWFLISWDYPFKKLKDWADLKSENLAIFFMMAVWFLISWDFLF